MDIVKVRTTGRVKLTANAECKKCEGRGIFVLSEYSQSWGELKVSVKLCGCVVAAFVGKPRLPKGPIAAELLTVVEDCG